MFWLLVLLILAAASVPQASAVIDPDPDGIGVYFDLAADQNQTGAPASVPVFAYVILTNPTGDEIQGFEFAYHISVPPGMEALLFRLQMGWPPEVPLDLTLPIYDTFSDEIVAVTSTPIPASSAVILLTWQFLLLAPMETNFFLGPTSGEPPSNGRLTYVSETEPVAMNLSTGGPDVPVATINGDAAVPISSSTFGSLKTLYR